MRLQELLDVLDEITPIRNAESWDNVGLLAGDPEQTVSRVMLTIDYTQEVADEAKRENCDCVIAYHPPIFEAIKRLTATGQGLIFDAIRRGVAIYSPHTALDVADGGTNDMLADAMGLPADARTPLRLSQPKVTQYKLVTFVPEKDLEAVNRSLFKAGAGVIGKYTSCSFQSPGTGTFFGEQGTNPTVGEAGQLERAAEVRIETVVAIAKVPAIVKALNEAHPYETPAFDLQQLAAPPEGLGLGRIGDLPEPVTRLDLIDRIKRALGVDHLLIAGPTEGYATRVAACAGACGDLLNDALSQNAQLYLTGEMRHHDAVKAARHGLTVVCALHSNSERPVLTRLAKRIQDRLSGLTLLVSREDRDPFAIR